MTNPDPNKIPGPAQLSALQKMPKGDLHVHLNGLVSLHLVQKLIEENGIAVPENFRIPEDLIQRTPSSLQDYLKAWDILRLVPTSRNQLRLLIESAFESLNAENIRFAEIRSSILYIALNNDIPVDVAIGWMLEDMDAASERTGIRYGLIPSVPRGEYVNEHLNAVLRAYRKLGRPRQIVGLDLSGNEDIQLPQVIATQYARAKNELGLHITIHAGETGGTENIRTAVLDYQADRIGHGTAILNDPALTDLIRERSICIEVCPVSNRLTGAVPVDQPHPVTRFKELGIPFVICSDNPNIHEQGLSGDYAAFLDETGDTNCVERMFETQKKYAFLANL